MVSFRCFLAGYFYVSIISVLKLASIKYMIFVKIWNHFRIFTSNCLSTFTNNSIRRNAHTQGRFDPFSYEKKLFLCPSYFSILCIVWMQSAPCKGLHCTRRHRNIGFSNKLMRRYAVFK